MYVHWVEHLVHRINALLSFSVNGLLIYVIQDDKKVKLGHYRFLIFIFAMFNLTSTVTDNLIPLRVHDYKYAFSVFVVSGLFEKRTFVGEVLLSWRCSLISATYGILHSHFVYRYLALYRSKLLTNFFVPYGLVLTILNCILPMAIWFWVCYALLTADNERRLYVQAEIMEHYQGDVFDANIIVALYQGGSKDAVISSWVGIGTMSGISVASIIIDVVLGILIIRKLKDSGLIMSSRMRTVQTQLMKALTVQVTVPMMASFLPCLFAWYKPIFKLSFGQWIDACDAVAISFFPVLDPIALFYFVPAFNDRLKQIFSCRSHQRRVAKAPSTVETA